MLSKEATPMTRQIWACAQVGGDSLRSVCIARLTCRCSKYVIYKTNGMLQNTHIKISSNTDGGVERMKSLSALHASRSGDWTAHSSQFSERKNCVYTHSVTVRTSFVSIYTCCITIFLWCPYEHHDTRLRERLILRVLRIQFFLDVTLWRNVRSNIKTDALSYPGLPESSNTSLWECQNSPVSVSYSEVKRSVVAVNLFSRSEWFKFWPKHCLIWRTFLVISGIPRWKFRYSTFMKTCYTTSFKSWHIISIKSWYCVPINFRCSLSISPYIMPQ